MATSTTGYDYPTMMQQFYAPKSARGSRLGRGPAMASTMVQYGYSQPGTNINVSPTFSNIGNPDVYTEGLSIGDVSLGDFGGGFDEEAPTPTPGPTPGAPAGPTGGTSGGGAPKPPVGSSLKLSGSAMEALRKAEQKGQSKDPRVTKGELKSVLQGGGQGPRGIRNAILEGKVQVGGKAADFLNRQLEKVGGKPLPKVQTKSDPAPKKGGGGQKQQPVPVIGLMNKASQPGTTNMKPQAQPKKQEAPKQQAKQQAPKPAAPKAEAKKKAEAKASGGKKKK